MSTSHTIERCQFQWSPDGGNEVWKQCNRLDTERVEMWQGGFVFVCPKHRRRPDRPYFTSCTDTTREDA